MNFILIVVGFVVAVLSVAVVHNCCLLVGWRYWGLKPRLLKQKRLERTVDNFVSQFIQAQAGAAERMGNPFSDTDKERIDSVMKDYTRKAITWYVQDCQLYGF